MEITCVDFLLMASGVVRIVVTLLIPQPGNKPPLEIKLEKDVDYSNWATAALVIALGDSGEDNEDSEDSDDSGVRH